ncbi:flagellar filament capping protein FliD [Clostridium polynesiense]|uniref:flagellar filament capping protein FliD n=1 Tax=Clostridium polynesiense TaxID=1325933 RepID=UPI0006939419|nr:flagellar filament capping protein FliD [Clostridium polynesiense]
MNISGAGPQGTTDYGRLTGLATGMDIEGMIKGMLAKDKARMDKVGQDRQYLQWQQESYVDIIKDLKEFERYFDILSPENMFSSSTYTGTRVDSNSKMLSASTLSGAIKGNYEILIKQLANPPKFQGSFNLQAGEASKSTKLSEAGITDGNFTINYGNENYTIDIKGTDTINDLISKIKNAPNSKGEPLGNFINVNFSDITKKLTVEGKNTGETVELTINAGTSNFADKTGMIGTHKGDDAIVSIKAPGESTFSADIKKSTNNFTIDGVNYNLLKASPNIAEEFTVTSDASASVEKFKGFIEKYNSLVEKINTKINEKKEYKYRPLTEEQKKDMKEDEIKKWEEKAKTGLLKRDNNLSKLLSDLREAVYNTVEGAGVSITDLGISTTKNYMDGGKLQIDENKLKAALENNGDLAEKLFTQSGSENKTNGIFTRFKNILKEDIGIDGVLIKKAGYKDSRWAGENDLTEKINDKNKVLKELERKLQVKQEMLYRKFAVLEKNMNSLNSQSSWLASQMGMA